MPKLPSRRKRRRPVVEYDPRLAPKPCTNPECETSLSARLRCEDVHQTRAQRFDHACPWCGQEGGFRCVTPSSGRPLYNSLAHASRQEGAA